MNTVTIVGNLTRDVELKEAGESTVAVMGVAESRKKKDGEKVPQYHEVEAWGILAEHAAASLAKGDQVIVEGKLRYDYFESNGSKRVKAKIVANTLGPTLMHTDVRIVRKEKVEEAAA